MRERMGSAERDARTGRRAEHPIRRSVEEQANKRRRATRAWRRKKRTGTLVEGTRVCGAVERLERAKLPS